jgi:hypothetical protein
VVSTISLGRLQYIRRGTAGPQKEEAEEDPPQDVNTGSLRLNTSVIQSNESYQTIILPVLDLQWKGTELENCMTLRFLSN